ncbi:MAG: hypothetical protein Q4C52_05120 [Eubacteriales bacterium]|nr:hypothetical protein [Eubacteriales bacterium]
MIRVPHTYAEWAEVLKAYKDKTNDQDVLKAMQKGTLEWQSGVAERFTEKYLNATNNRLNMAADKFQRDYSRAAGSEGAVIQALIAMRKELAFLMQAADIPAVPEEVRGQFKDIVRKQADSVQSSLEDSAKKDRSGKLSSIIRNHKVNNF